MHLSGEKPGFNVFFTDPQRRAMVGGGGRGLTFSLHAACDNAVHGTQRSRATKKPHVYIPTADRLQCLQCLRPNNASLRACVSLCVYVCTAVCVRRTVCVRVYRRGINRHPRVNLVKPLCRAGRRAHRGAERDAPAARDHRDGAGVRRGCTSCIQFSDLTHRA